MSFRSVQHPAFYNSVTKPHVRPYRVRTSALSEYTIWHIGSKTNVALRNIALSAISHLLDIVTMCP